MSKTMVRQGDVLLVLEPCQRELFRVQKSTPDDVVLARGEKTGHSHKVSALDARLCEVFNQDASASQMVLDVFRETELRHEEHAPIVLSRGTYRVVLQREYDPVSERGAND